MKGILFLLFALFASSVATRISRVIDGDTLIADAPWVPDPLPKHIYIRVAGVDTPELKGKCATERALAVRAKQYVEQFIADSDGEVKVDFVSWDKYGGRIVGRISGRDGTDLARALIHAGLGKTYAGGRKINWCASAR